MGVWKRVRNIKRYYVDSAWQTILPQYEDETDIKTMIEFDNKLYVGTNPNGKLLEFDGSATWQLKADTYSSQQTVRIAEFNSKIYGGTYPDGLLLEWNSTGENWDLVCEQLSSQYVKGITAGSTALYASTYPDGMLFKYDIGSTEWVMVADKYTTLSVPVFIDNIKEFNSKIYGCSYLWVGGKGANTSILEYNSTGGKWDVVGETGVDGDRGLSLGVYDSNLYLGTLTEGRLYLWDGSTGLTQKAGPLVEGFHGIVSLVEFDSKLYGGTGYNDIHGGKLFKWNNVDTWAQAADQVNGNDNNYIYGLAELNGVLYGATSDKGQLLKFVDR